MSSTVSHERDRSYGAIPQTLEGIDVRAGKPNKVEVIEAIDDDLVGFELLHAVVIEPTRFYVYFKRLLVRCLQTGRGQYLEALGQAICHTRNALAHLLLDLLSAAL